MSKSLANKDITGDWEVVDHRKMVHPEHGTYLKIGDFPTNIGTQGETLWVKHLSGTEFIGTGMVSCKPKYCTDVALGDYVEFSGGTIEHLPHFVEKAQNTLKKAANS